uniref:AlNc14C366G11056 protein n=1 Tax=Albugo laibachii Nc14 TaxID=890382 RepID=F0WXX1_9STRA|nr:AlNc14C366G11056 [Albugo laibachii Nc14]|eukprot:CCA26319.1 AlNc14C366G11056 [Albugo laibachii Nc14]
MTTCNRFLPKVHALQYEYSFTTYVSLKAQVYMLITACLRTAHPAFHECIGILSTEGWSRSGRIVICSALHHERVESFKQNQASQGHHF